MTLLFAWLHQIKDTKKCYNNIATCHRSLSLMSFFYENQCPYESCGYASYKSVTCHIYKIHHNQPLPVNVFNRRTKMTLIWRWEMWELFSVRRFVFLALYLTICLYLQNNNNTATIEEASDEEIEEILEESQELWEGESMFGVDWLHY